DVLDVGQVGLVLDRQVANRGFTDVGQQWLAVGEQRAGEKYPITQPSLRRLDATEPAEPDHGLERQCRGEDDVSPSGLDPANVATLGGRKRGERLHQLGQLVRGYDVTLHAKVEPVVETLRRRGQIAHSAT